MKRFLILMMALVLCFGLVSCGGAEDKKAEAENEAEKTPVTEDIADSEETEEIEETEPVEDSKVDYTVTVTDEAGAPVAGAVMQICSSENCIPSMVPSDENGKIVFNVEEGEYKVSFLALPEGYTYVDETVTDFYFESASFEITVVIKANA